MCADVQNSKDRLLVFSQNSPSCEVASEKWFQSNIGIEMFNGTAKTLQVPTPPPMGYAHDDVTLHAEPMCFPIPGLHWLLCVLSFW